MSSMLNEYRNDLDSLQFSNAALDRMIARLEDATTQAGSDAPAVNDASNVLQPSSTRATRTPIRRAASQDKYSVRRILRIAASLIIAAALGLGATGAYAVATQRSLPAVFSDIFGGAPAQTEIIDNIGHPIGASATSNGVTITADAVIGSANSCTMVFSISRDDGKTFEDVVPGTDATYPLLWATDSIQIDGVQGLGSGAYFYDADPADSSIQYVYTINNATTFDEGSLSGRTARVRLNNLSLAHEQADDTTVIAKGTWDLKFQLNYQDSSVTLSAGQELELNGMHVTVNKLSVSPIGASITYTVDAVSTTSENPEELPSDAFVHLPFVVTFKNGHTADGTDADASTRERNGRTIVTKSFVFDTIVSVDDIAFITVGNQSVPVE